jgi:2-methylcitrate dehydratase PrpD
MSQTASRQLAEFAVNLTLDEIPQEVIRNHKEHLLDGLGNGLYGATTELGRQVVAMVDADSSGSGTSQLWGSRRKLSCQRAAFANGTFANIAELEDGHTLTKLKPNTCIVPAAIAVADLRQSSGDELLVALVAGLEVALRVGLATGVGKEGYARGWIATSAIGQFGAAVAAGRLLGLNGDQMVDALALAGMQPCGVWSTGLTAAKRVAIGRAAENGIFAAMMAAQGIAGGDQIFDGEWGSIGDIISTRYDRALLTRGLGQEWLCSTVALKCYPTKGGVHCSLDGILEIARSEPDLRAADVREIVIRTTTGVAKNKALSTFPPSDFWQAQNSLPYLVARAFIDRKLGLKQIEDAALRDEEALALGRKVRLLPDADADATPPEAKTAFVDVTLQNGRVVSTRVDYCSGEPQKPLTRDQLNDKFRDVASFVLPESDIHATIDMVDSLETVSNCRHLTALLTCADRDAA